MSVLTGLWSLIISLFRISFVVGIIVGMFAAKWMFGLKIPETNNKNYNLLEQPKPILKEKSQKKDTITYPKKKHKHRNIEAVPQPKSEDASVKEYNEI
jgi:hypothetical protein